MSNGLRQISMSFVATEDRLLFRLKTRDNKEYRLFLTRRFVLLGLWPAIRSLLAADPEVRRMTDEAQKQTMLSFRHDGFVDKSAFEKTYEETDDERPLGDDPIIVTGLKAVPKDGGYALTFKLIDGKTVALRFDEKLMHNFCKLLFDLVNKADWDVTIGFDTTDGGDGTATTRVH